MRTRIFALALLPALLPTLMCTAPSLAADATSFDPTKVQITAKATSSIPVGTVVTWPSGANPADMQNPDGTYNWLECNGQSISQTVYRFCEAARQDRPETRRRTASGATRTS